MEDPSETISADKLNEILKKIIEGQEFELPFYQLPSLTQALLQKIQAKIHQGPELKTMQADLKRHWLQARLVQFVILSFRAKTQASVLDLAKRMYQRHTESVVSNFIANNQVAIESIANTLTNHFEGGEMFMGEIHRLILDSLWKNHWVEKTVKHKKYQYYLLVIPVSHKQKVFGSYCFVFITAPDEFKKRYVLRTCAHLGLMLHRLENEQNFALDKYLKQLRALSNDVFQVEFPSEVKLSAMLYEKMIDEFLKERLALQNSINEHKTTHTLAMAKIHHEFRSPLTTIQELTNLLSKLILDNGQGDLINDFLIQIQSAIAEIDQGLNKLKFVDEIQNKEYHIIASWLDSESFLKDIKSRYANHISAQGLSFEVIDRFNGCFFNGEACLKHVLYELIENAIKFTHHGFIRLELDKSDSPTLPLVLRVTDSGIGIDSEYQQNIFKAFNSVEARLDRLSSGLGLGLYIVIEHIKLMHGEIVVRSDLGQGSCFEVYLPIEVPINGQASSMNNLNTLHIEPVVKSDAAKSQPQKQRNVLLTDELHRIKVQSCCGLKVVLIADDVLQGFKLATWLEEQGVWVQDLMMDEELAEKIAELSADLIIFFGFDHLPFTANTTVTQLHLPLDSRIEELVAHLEATVSSKLGLVQSSSLKNQGN